MTEFMGKDGTRSQPRVSQVAVLGCRVPSSAFGSRSTTSQSGMHSLGRCLQAPAGVCVLRSTSTVFPILGWQKSSVGCTDNAWCGVVGPPSLLLARIDGSTVSD